MRGIVALGLTVFATGCVTVTNPNAPPGGMLFTEKPAISWLPGASLAGGHAGSHTYIRIRVFAPPGTRQCETGFWQSESGPERRAKPDANGVVTLSTAQSKPAHITCETRHGKIERTVPWISFPMELHNGQSVLLDEDRPGTTLHFGQLPPLVHMTAGNPDFDAHWAAVRKELCPSPIPGDTRDGLICTPGIFEQLKAADAAGG